MLTPQPFSPQLHNFQPTTPQLLNPLPLNFLTIQPFTFKPFLAQNESKKNKRPQDDLTTVVLATPRQVSLLVRMCSLSRTEYVQPLTRTSEPAKSQSERTRLPVRGYGWGRPTDHCRDLDFWRGFSGRVFGPLLGLGPAAARRADSGLHDSPLKTRFGPGFPRIGWRCSYKISPGLEWKCLPFIFIA